MGAGEFSTFESTTGGVMTVEVGTVTGELEVCTKPTDGGIEVTIRYAEADEWYTVEGSPVREVEDCHKRVIERLTTPGEKRGFNEEPVSVTELNET